MPMSPREVAEQVRKMVAGEGVVFADLSTIDQKTNGARVAPSGTGFDVPSLGCRFQTSFGSPESLVSVSLWRRRYWPVWDKEH